MAFIQSNLCVQKLKENNLCSTIKVFKTSGDRILDKPLHEIGGKGVFIKELEEALLHQKAQLAVHSLKDLPAKVDPPFKLVCYLPRTYNGDCLLLCKKFINKNKIPQLPKVLNKEHIASMSTISIGTGSLRRTCLLQEASSKVNTTPIRGNVDTRIQKMLQGTCDALVLSEAALHKLQITSNNDFHILLLDPKWFTPCAGQGTVVIETLDNKHTLNSLLDKISCKQTAFLTEIERAVLAGLGGSCLLPIGIHAFYENKDICCNISIFDNLGQSLKQSSVFSNNTTHEQIIKQIINDLYKNNVNMILSALGLEPISQY